MYLSLTTVSVAQPLLQLYGNNLAVFTTARYSGLVVVAFALGVLLVPPVCLVAIDVVLSAVPRVRPLRVHHGLVWLSTWPFVSMLLRGVSVGWWPMDAVVSCALAGGITFIYSRRSKVRAWLSTLSMLAPVVLVLFVMSAMPVIRPARSVAVPAEGSVAHPTASIVWIVLDEAPLFPLMGSDGTINSARFPGFAALASSSTWYRNVVATSQKTTDAVPAMLEGKWPTGGQPVLSDHPRNLFTALGRSMDMDVSEAVTAMCPDSLCRSTSSADTVTRIPAVRGRASFASFLRDASIVVGHKLLPRGLREHLPAIDEGWGDFGASASGDSVPAGGSGTAAVRTGHAGRVQTLETLIRNAASSGTTALHFAHVLLPHKPWTLAPDLRMSSRPENDPRPITNLDRRRDAYQSHLRQYVAVDSVIGELVRTLKASDNWDNTMVVVTADHGLTFVPGESYRDVVNPDNPQTLDDIYRVPLFVKYPRQSTGVIDDCPVSSVDILPTVLSSVGVDTGWTFDGSDISSACPARSTRTIRWPKGHAELRTGVPELLGRVKYYNQWVDADTDASGIVRAGLSGSLVGARVPANAARESALEWKLANRDAFDSVGEGRFAQVPTRAYGTIHARRTFTRDTEGLVEVDGVFVAAVSELAGLRSGGSTYFVAPVETSLMHPGHHTVRLWTARWVDGSPTLRLVG